MTTKAFCVGACAGAIETSCMYPADAVKTRCQFAGSGNSILNAARALVNERALYRGFSMPLMCDPPKRALKFASNEFFSNMLCPTGLTPTDMPQHLFFVSGALVGLTETCFESAFENVKVRMQAGNQHLYTNAAHCARAMVAEEGLGRLYRGFSAHCARNMIWNSCYFGIYKTASGILPIRPNESKTEELTRKFVTGAVAGGSGCFLNTPFDVVKSRMQRGSDAGGSNPYQRLLPSLAKIYKEEGASTLFHGLEARVFRLGIGGGIMVVVVDVLGRYWPE